jgi:hypothetical protein
MTDARPRRKSAKFAALRVRNVPVGSTVTMAVTCKGKGCPAGLKGQGLRQAKRLRRGEPEEVHRDAAPERDHDHRRLEAERDQRREDPHGAQGDVARVHHEVHSAGLDHGGRLQLTLQDHPVRMMYAAV